MLNVYVVSFFWDCDKHLKGPLKRVRSFSGFTVSEISVHASSSGLWCGERGVEGQSYSPYGHQKGYRNRKASKVVTQDRLSGTTLVLITSRPLNKSNLSEDQAFNNKAFGVVLCIQTKR